MCALTRIGVSKSQKRLVVWARAMESNLAKFFGTPPGVSVGDSFRNRRDLHDGQVHRPLQAGIPGTGAEGADSIVVSGGYEDDEDHGDYIIYTGHGGKDPNSSRQIADQSVDASGNAGLITSKIQGLPVRVVRGVHRTSAYAPHAYYQYAGLFTVEDWWLEKGKQGFDVVRFRLDRLPEQAKLWTKDEPELDPSFATTTVTRRIRDTALSRHVKAIYNNRCQLCQTAIPGFGERTYSEGAHVKPLGRPHLGGDTLSNLLCLCPNHHTQLDIGGLFFADDLTARAPSTSSLLGTLTFVRTHVIDLENIRYHRQHWLTGKIS